MDFSSSDNSTDKDPSDASSHFFVPSHKFSWHKGAQTGVPWGLELAYAEGVILGPWLGLHQPRARATFVVPTKIWRVPAGAHLVSLATSWLKPQVSFSPLFISCSFSFFFFFCLFFPPPSFLIPPSFNFFLLSSSSVRKDTV